ncbi:MULTISPECIES: ester cyclase [unclassified Crossiella]|uniref:ester cyclase n=1 Tax=unclassified Crossiella TaxID=2620835 RepID=UPI001FFF13AF|nr:MULTISPECIES: ester cyclase [unclassified Crossiella]MCK2239042.1 ester cyclase [Crossiella sp. S99.2]MCK2251389.1 ester cyclase [Crossiella sp. S99.1]
MTTPACTLAKAFFAAFARHDTEAMVALCGTRARLDYPAFEIPGKTRVLRADGHVRTIGRPLWSGLIMAFPDLTVDLRSLVSDHTANVAAKVVLAGTQKLPWGNIPCQGRSFESRQLFILRMAADGLIGAVTAYWCNSDLGRQLGYHEVN